MKVAIADYGAGNLRSLSSALVRAGAEPVVDPMCGSGTFVIEAAEIAD